MSHFSSHSLDTDTPSKKHTDEYKNDNPSGVANVSQNQVIQHRKVKEPPSFRGDGSDTVEIEEWEDLMRTFVKKSNMSADEHVEEILVHLRGKAKDVVKFWIRNCDSTTTVCPNSFYSLLRKHFSCSHYSPVPLADFYTTLPEEDENPYDYWLRLNKAADVASECLREQGKTLDNPSVEIVHMFIRHCPNKDFALTFRSKPIDNGQPMKYRLCLMTINLTYHSKPPVQCITAKVKEFQLTSLMLIQFQCLLPRCANSNRKHRFLCP